MGNENSKTKDPTQNGKVCEKHGNHTSNGLNVHITSNGVQIDANGEAIVPQNGQPMSSSPIESNETDYVIIQSDFPQTETKADSSIQEKQADQSEKETTPDQKDASLVDNNPPLELGSREEEAAITFVTEHSKEGQHPHQRVETSTQTEQIAEVHNSTQTGENGNTSANSKLSVEDITIADMVTTEEHLVTETVEIAEEVTEDTAIEEPSAIHPIIIEKALMENVDFENFVFRAERVEITGNFETSGIIHDYHEGEDVNDLTPQVNPTESIAEGETATEEIKIVDSLEISPDLPQVVADCIEAVLTAAAEFTDDASEQRADEVITEDTNTGAGDASADAVPIETTGAELNAITLEDGAAISLLEKSQIATGMDTILEVVYEETICTPVNEDTPMEDLSVQEEITVDDPGVVPEINQPDNYSEEIVITEVEILEVPSTDNALVATDEQNEDKGTQNNPVLEAIATDKAIKVDENVVTGVESETTEEPEATVASDAGTNVEIPEEAINALSQEFETSTIPSQETAAQDVIEEVIAATVFLPLSAEPEAINPEQPVLEQPMSGVLVIKVDPLEETVSLEERSKECEKALGQSDSSETPAQITANPCVEEETSEVLESIVESVLGTVLETLEVIENTVKEIEDVQATEPPPQEQAEGQILETTEEEVTVMKEESHAVSTIVEENSDESQTTAIDEYVEECFEAVIETIVEEVITEDAGRAEGQEQVAVAECESTKNITAAPSPRRSMETLLLRLQSTCTSVVQESLYELGGLDVSSLGYTINVTISVAPQEERQ